MFNTVVLTSVLATAASASMVNGSAADALVQRQADAAPVTVTNTVTVTSCPASVSDCTSQNAAVTKYITVPCTEQSASPVGTSAPPPPPPAPPAPSSEQPPAPPAPASPAPPAVTTAPPAPIDNKNTTIPESTAPIDLPVESSTMAIPSSSGPVTSTSSCPPGGCETPRVSRASANSANSVSLAAGVAMVVAAISLF